MQIIAKLTQLLSVQTGSGKNGVWKKQDLIVETDGQFPKKICISVWGDNIKERQLQNGNLLKIYFDIESREYNNKWYTDIKAWKIEEVNKNNHNITNSKFDRNPDEFFISDVEDENAPF